MAIDTFKLGWNAGGKIIFGTNPFYANKPWTETGGATDLLTIDVLMTAGDVSKNRTPSIELMSSIGEIDSNESRVKVLLADGIQAISGNISFTCDKAYMQSLLERLFEKRKESFSVYIGTEEFTYVHLSSCKWNNFSINCSEGVLLNCTVAFVSNRDFEIIKPDEAFFTPIFKNSNMIPYWQTGVLKDTDVLKISTWDLSLTQNVTPAYLNTSDLDLPAYLRVGNWEFVMNAQMLVGYEEDPVSGNIHKMASYNKIQIGVIETLKPIILTAEKSVNMSASVSFGGLDAMGNYTSSLELVGIPDSYTNNASISEPFTLTFT